ncbi:MAG: hypothetical protein KDE28_09250, partial [Anaerolineales bacterium]|nr:hypothetical protein [Anaerolineales bacterium]
GLVLGGVGQQHLTDRPYALWRALWRDFFTLRPDMDLPAQKREVASQVERLYPDGMADLHLWYDALGMPKDSENPTGELLTAEGKRARLHNLVQETFAAAAMERP